MSLPVPALAFLAAPLVVAVGLFVLLRWWVGKTGPTLLLTSSLMLNLTLFGPLALAIVLAMEVRDFQDKMPTAPKLLLVEKGPDILLAVSFTEVKDLEQGFSSFRPLTKEQVARLSQLGDAKYEAITRNYYKVFVAKRELLERLAAPAEPPSQGPQGRQGPQGAQGPQAPSGPAMMDPLAIMRLLSSAREAFMSGDLDRVAREALDMQRAFQQGGMEEAAGLARQMEQAARARDTKALEALGQRLAQLAAPGAGGQGPPVGGSPLGGGGPSLMPIANDVVLRAIDAEDPVSVLSQYLPPPAIQEMSGGDPARLKLMLLAFLLQGRGFDPLFLLKEYQAGHIQVYPASAISTIAKLLPLAVLPQNLPLP